jgi:broad specificity phosphatase PhoE
MADDKRTLYLVRHGLPDYRDGKASDEFPGPPLSDLGYVQARQTARVVAQYPVQRIYTSPLARARETAECLAGASGAPLVIESELREWHRTESLYNVGERSARWLARWLAKDEPCAIAVGHASPLLGLLRTALYLSHVRWYRGDSPQLLQLSSQDRFEISMASLTAIHFTPEHVTAEMVFHPTPRIVDAQHGPLRRCFPRPVHGNGENVFIRRPNLARLYGFHRAPTPSLSG